MMKVETVTLFVTLSMCSESLETSVIEGQDYSDIHRCTRQKNSLKGATVKLNHKLNIKCERGCLKIRQVFIINFDHPFFTFLLLKANYGCHSSYRFTIPAHRKKIGKLCNHEESCIVNVTEEFFGKKRCEDNQKKLKLKY